MKKSVKSKKDHFRQLELERGKLIQYLLLECSLIQCSYSELLVKCGKPGCHCEDKPAHLVTHLGTRKNNAARTQVVRIADRQRVCALVQVYKKHKAALTDLKDIHQQQEKIVRDLVDDKDQPYE